MSSTVRSGTHRHAIASYSRPVVGVSPAATGQRRVRRAISAAVLFIAPSQTAEPLHARRLWGSRRSLAPSTRPSNEKSARRTAMAWRATLGHALGSVSKSSAAPAKYRGTGRGACSSASSGCAAQLAFSTYGRAIAQRPTVR